MWIGRSYVTALTLNRLAARDIEAMIDGVVGNNLIPPSIRQDIIVRTDGIPLFVEVGVNRVNIVDALFLIIFGQALRGPRQLR